MKLYYFICACMYVVLASNIKPSLAGSYCVIPKYGSFQALVSGTCDVKSWVRRFESICKECMYLDSQGRKLIGINFNLEQPDAKAILAHFGADYDSIVNGASTAINMPCHCNTTVTCLNLSQINNLFDESVENAFQKAQHFLPELDRYSNQNVVN